MANSIKRSEISEEDVFKNIRDSAIDTIKKLSEINNELNETASILKKDISKAKFGNTKEINAFTKAINEATKARKNAMKVDKQMTQAVNQKTTAEINLQRVKREKLKTEREEFKNAQQLSREQERQAKATERATKAARSENSEYKKLAGSTRDLKNKSKDLGAQLRILEMNGKRNTKEFRQLSMTYRQVTKEAQNGDKALKKIDATVGDNFRNVGNYEKGIGKLKNVLGQLGLAFGAFQLLKSAGQTIVEFDKQVKNLVSITGASGKDLEFFKEQAKSLGTEVTGGASAVIEAYKLIGSAKPELLKNSKALDSLTQSAIKLSQASGLELPDAATRLTDAMNQFGAPAEDASRFINVLANASLEGSAAIPDVTDSLLKFGAVARTSNVSIEESAALIETLASKGLKGAEGGTALRNVMLKLSAPDALPKEAVDMMKKLGISLEDVSDTSVPFTDRLRAMKPLLKDNAALQKVFGLENEVAAINLLELTDETDKLTEAMHNQGTVSKQAKENTDTIEFAFNKLKETFSSMILNMNESSGAGGVVKTLLTTIANNLELIVVSIGKVVLAWGIYKTALMASKAVTFLFNGGLNDTIKSMTKQIPLTKSYRLEQIKLSRATKQAGQSAKTAGKAMNAVPWVLIISLAVELGAAIWDLASGNQQNRIQAELYAKAQEKALNTVAKLSESTAKRIKASTKLIDENKAKGLIDDQEANRLKKEAVDQEIRDNGRLISKLRERRKESIANVENIKKQITANEELKRTSSIKEGGGIEALEEGKKLQKQLLEANAETRLRRKEIESLNEQQETLNDTSFQYNIELTTEITNLKATREESKKTERATKDLNTEFSNQIDLLDELNDQFDDYLDSQIELSEINRDKIISDLNDQIDAELALLQVQAESGQKGDTTNIESLLNKRKAEEIKGIEERRDIEIAEEKKSFTRKFEDLRKNTDEQRAKLLDQDNLTVQARAEIEKNYQAELEKIRLLELDAKETLDTKILSSTTKAKNEILEVERDTQKEIDGIKNDLNDTTTAKILEDEEKARQDQLEKDKKYAEDRKAIAQAVTDFLNKKAQERIDKLDEEISKAETETDRLQKLADEGNIKAEQSLARQNEIINEANKQKIKEEQAIQRNNLINAGLQTYNSKVEAGSDNPLADTLRDIAFLQNFLSSLPAFYEGTDTTVDKALGAPMMSGRDGHVIRVDGQEKILNPALSDMTGDMTTSQIAKVSQDFLNGKLVNNNHQGALQIGNSWDTSALESKLDELVQTIESKQETEYNFEQLADKLFLMIKSQKKGNTVIHNRYRKEI